MGMKKIPIEQLRPDMKFSKSLFDKNLNIVLAAGKKLDAYTLKNLKLRNVEYVETAGELIEDAPIPDEYKKDKDKDKDKEKKKILVDKDTAKHLEIYKDTVTNLGFLYNRYKDGMSFNTDKLQRLASALVNAIMIEKNPNTFINLINITGKGEYLYNHMVNTTILAVLLGQQIGYSIVKLTNLAMAGLIFDIGMVKIPAYISEKEEKLTAEEFNKIKTHPIYSYQIISRELNMPVEIARVGLEHHERWDGTGYPRKIKNIDISEMSRIISIIDTYEALTKERVYRPRQASYDAMKTVLGEGSKKFDPDLLKVFLNMMSIYPVGSHIRLNNNAIARVISADPVSPFRPTVKIVYDEFGDKVDDGEIIRLSKEKDLYIIKAVKSASLSNEEQAKAE
jgi:HD-GYP domain-containing protein (c-di-GMP phosphodiesterase class II)